MKQYNVFCFCSTNNEVGTLQIVIALVTCNSQLHTISSNCIIMTFGNSVMVQGYDRTDCMAVGLRRVVPFTK